MCGTLISPIALTALSLSFDRPFYNVTARRADGRDSAGYPIIVFVFPSRIRCIHIYKACIVAKRQNRKKKFKFKYPKRFAHCVHISYSNSNLHIYIYTYRFIRTYTMHDICTLEYTVKIYTCLLPAYKQTTYTARETSRACIKETKNALTVRLTTAALF